MKGADLGYAAFIIYEGTEDFVDTNVIIAIISLFGTLAGSLGGILISAKLTNYRLQQLESKVDKHNGFAEKIPLLQLRMDNFDEKLKELKVFYDEKNL